ncbi:MAG: YceI family protein [Bacteroidales bacterium]
MKGRIRMIKAMILAMIIVAPLSLMSFDLNVKGEDGTTYKLVNDKSSLTWKGTKPGGEHIGVIKVVKGKVKTEGTAITGGNFTIDMNTIVNKDLTNESFNKKLVDHLRSEDFFHTEAHPEANFKIKSVVAERSSKDGFTANHKVTGDLTIRGITHQISFPANIKVDEASVKAKSGEIVLDRTKWNVNYQSRKVFAELKDNYIHDEMYITLDLHFDKK